MTDFVIRELRAVIIGKIIMVRYDARLHGVFVHVVATHCGGCMWAERTRRGTA